MRQSAVIQRNWQSLIKPEKLEVEPGADPSRVATVVAEPLERGFGMALGNSLPSGPNGDKSGYGLTANGINNWYLLCAKGSRCDYRFAIFLFTNSPEKANVTFRVLSPAAKSVYTYTWASDSLPRGSVWFYADATGNFSATGTYYAEVYGNSTLLGWIPLLFTAR